MVETVPSKPFSVGGLFEDPNFQLLLANLGRQADPEGAGGVIGSAAANMISSKAAQQAGEKLLNEDEQGVTRKLGGLTPKGTPGVNSVARKANGTLDIDLDHPNADTVVSTLGGYSPLGTEGVNSVTKRPSGSLLVNYDPPSKRTPIIADEVSALAAAPTASRDRSKLSYAPITPAQVQADIDSTLEPYLARRSL